MKNFKRFIGHIFTKKNIKIIVSLFIVLCLFVWTSFAQSNWDSTMTPVEEISYLMHIIISILSWWRLILATLAWKFMTNDFVYGSFLNLDSSLWNLWNMMKNLANFALWFILIFTIVKNLFKWSLAKEDTLKNAKDLVLNTLFAWVLIQMSWFLIAVMIDLSTIGTAAVWSLPSQFIIADSGFQNNMSQLLWSVQNRIEIDLSTTWNITNVIKSTWNINSEVDVNKLLDTIMPSSESMVWPFIFLWGSVFNLYDLTDTSKNLSGTDDRSELFLSLWINWFVLFIFSVSLFLVFLFNLFRVITLRIVIPLSPFVFMLFAFSRGWKSPIKLDKFLGDVMNIKNIMKLIFMPVFMTLVLSIVLIVMVLLRSLIKADNWNLDLTEHNNMTIESHKNWNWDEAFYDSSLDVANIANVKLHFKDSLVDILMYIICLCLMVMLVKSCISKGTWIKFIDDKISWMSKILWGEKWNFWWLIWTAGVLPIWMDEKGNTVKVWIWTTIDYVKKSRERLDGRLDYEQQTQDKLVLQALWLENSNGDFDSLKYIVKTEEEREKWLEKAARIWKSKLYKTDKDFYNDKSFRAAQDYFNSKSAYGIDVVSPEVVANKMKKMEEEEETNSWTETEWT